jgi:hypothetical protein
MLMEPSVSRTAQVRLDEIPVLDEHRWRPLDEPSPRPSPQTKEGDRAVEDHQHERSQDPT